MKSSDILKRSFMILAVVGVFKPDKIPTPLYTIWRIMILPLPYLIFTLESLKAIELYEDLDALIELLFVTLTVLSDCCKSMTFLTHRSNMINLRKSLVSDIAMAQDDEEKKIQYKYRRFIRLGTTIVVCFFLYTSFMFEIQPVLENPGERILPFPLWLPYDSTASDKIYWITYTILFIGIMVGTLFNVLGDTVIFGFLIEACGQFDLLIHRFSIMPECDPKDEELTLRRNIKHHYFVLEYIDNFTAAFQPIITSQFMLSGIIITLSVYKLTMSSEQIDVFFLRNLIYFVVMLEQLFAYCWFSDKLTEKNNEFLRRIYAIDWTLLKTQTKKSIGLVMLRATKPIVITNGISTDLSMETFMSVIKICYSFFNILRESEYS